MLIDLSLRFFIQPICNTDPVTKTIVIAKMGKLFVRQYNHMYQKSHDPNIRGLFDSTTEYQMLPVVKPTSRQLNLSHVPISSKFDKSNNGGQTPFFVGPQ